MSKRLDDLKKQYEESRAVAAGLNTESAGLKEALSAKQELVMETVRKDLREFAGYAAGLNKGWYRMLLQECNLGNLDYFRRLYGDNCRLIVAFEPDGDVKLKCDTGGNRPETEVYDLKQDKWGWHGEKCKAYVTENWGMIAEKIEDGIAGALEKASKDVVSQAVKERDMLQESIGAVSENIDWNARKDAVLHNALSLLLNDIWETSDDRKEGLLMLLDDLGVTAEELEEMGIPLTEFEVAEKIDDVLKNATERSEEYDGFNAYDEIQRLTELRKERPLTQDEEETLFYCKNAVAEQDYYDSLESVTPRINPGASGTRVL